MNSWSPLPGRRPSAYQTASQPGVVRQVRTASSLALALVMLLLMLPVSAFGSERAYAPTAPGKIEVKELPAGKIMQSAGKGSYFDQDANLFRPLFRFIQANDLSMTVPVEADVSPGRMRFYVEKAKAPGVKGGTAEVEVRAVEKRTVVSIGMKGSYTREQYQDGVNALTTWLDQNPQWKAGGRPYAVYWDPPYVPGFMRTAEIHIPLVKR